MVQQYRALKNRYEIERTIGTGGFAKVKLATHISTGEKVAIKIMEKLHLGKDLHRVKTELEALKALSHHHISKLYEVIETPTHFFIVMEYCSGGELFDHIVLKKKLSEMQSRLFFRQILSAVAYAHSKGYAHRDLKPENVLLDKDQTLKLIDFGLCARPSGGLQCHLNTSCGSPTYAAPELIKSEEYLGSEVDVWSMGVLLYALLCGFLPFDADNIKTLYEKISNGHYEEPSWLSSGSKNLLKRMLEIDRKKRIKVDELLQDRWVTHGFYEPVAFNSLFNFDERDDECVKLMADQQGVDCDDMWGKVSEMNYDHDTATYLILLMRKKQGLPIKLAARVALPRFCVTDRRLLEENRRNEEKARTVGNNIVKYSISIYSKYLSYLQLPLLLNIIMCLCLIMFLVPAKMSTGQKAKHLEVPTTPQQKVPNPDWLSHTPRGLTSPGQKILGSIEKSFNKVRNVLTPKRKQTQATADQRDKPTVLTVKNMCNISTTSSSDPDAVFEKLKEALESRGIVCNAKGFTLRGKVEEDDSQANHFKLSFELEVCLMPSPAGDSANSAPLVVIRRKRLKGDAWCYKKICEEVLNLTVAPVH
ncbi:maternal embryonic leucine zipper kinase [Nilaparvata lugens]|uniref:maternal embryonic leucine zipper kinase n=1 Tax=Nilaparvata lugens TaxID=108931 RepID=UPI00193D60B3|nr:maternal embryonic leucine zipper kinase [Nilaparvata lugens]